MKSTLFWLNALLLIIALGLIIWLLARGSQAECKEGQKLNQSCDQTSDCNTGLVCEKTQNGITGVCKVPSGGVCATSNDCSLDLKCQNGICMSSGGGVNGPCPCKEGLTCVNNVCKIKIGGKCTQNTDCANGLCVNNICVVTNPDYFVELNSGCSDTSNCSDSSNCPDYSTYTDSSDHYKKCHKCSLSYIDCSCDTSSYSYYRSRSHKKNKKNKNNKKNKRYTYSDSYENHKNRSKSSDSLGFLKSDSNDGYRKNHSY